jgi:AraC-like DNA-binding protein
MRPQGVQSLLDATSSQFPEPAAWIAADGHREWEARVLPLGARMSLAANDVLSCSYTGLARRSYMRGKAIEMISAVVDGLEAQAAAPTSTKLSSQDRAKVALAFDLLQDDDGAHWTIGTLARRVGLNRTKLAAAFKQVYGMPIRKYWREANLDRARDLLESGRVSVTDVALDMGYADTYSFTRAFSQRFGVLPSACKPS